MLTWKGHDRFVLGETTFRTMAPDATRPAMGDGEFFIFKPRGLVEFYAAAVKELEPRRIFELGTFEGGSTLFFAELARPRRIVAIDREPVKQDRARLDSHAASRGLADVVRTFGEVDQANRKALAQIADEQFDGMALDLVVDDCSHMYEPTRASFNELFPRLRPGGVYVIEDWRWAHTAVGEEPLEGMFPAEEPLTRLLVEIVLAIPGMPDLVSELSVQKRFAVVRRGEAEVDPAAFDISACSNPRGRALLAASSVA
jgi:SAM-dependent methyltransferase